MSNIKYLIAENIMEEKFGLVILPGIATSDYEGPCEFTAKIITPNGNTVFALAQLAIPRTDNCPEIIKFIMGLKDMKKSDVPIGSKIFLPE